MNILERLEKEGKISPPGYVVGSLQYLTIMGSEAYGVTSGSSDQDLYGFCIPPKGMVFPHIDGYIEGFDNDIPKFEQWSQHSVMYNDREYDGTVYNIVKYFNLVAGCNPNMIDSLYTPQRCVLQCSKIGERIRANRKLFLHKGSFHTFRGYAFAQLHKAKTKNPEGKRRETVEKYGWDVKFGYHVVRLADEAEQILVDGTIDLERSRELLKAIRNGEWSLEDVEKWFQDKERYLEKLYHESNAVPYSPDRVAIKKLLLSCLEEYYGSLDNVIANKSDADKLLAEIKRSIEKAGF